MTVERLSLDDEEACRRWDEYVLIHPQGTLYHTTKWASAITRCYPVKNRSVFVLRNGGIVAVLPLFEVSTLTRQRLLVSVPFASDGGLLAAADEPLEVSDHEILEQHRCFLVPQLTPTRYETAFAALHLALPGDCNTLWRGLKDKVRNQVRKAQQTGLTITFGRESLDSFYPLIQVRMHELGTPPHRKAFYRELLRAYGQQAEFAIVSFAEKPIAALFDIEWGGVRYNLAGASDIRHRPLCANDFAYWNSLQRAMEHGKIWYDFGRSRREGTHSFFKKKWGATAYDVSKYIWAYNRKEKRWTEQDAAVDSVLSRYWPRLPLFLANSLGAYLRQYVY